MPTIGSLVSDEVMCAVASHAGKIAAGGITPGVLTVLGRGVLPAPFRARKNRTRCITANSTVTAAAWVRSVDFDNTLSVFLA
jgi:hypothetical protein